MLKIKKLASIKEKSNTKNGIDFTTKIIYPEFCVNF